MPDLLTRRNNTWHFVRRVPAAFAQLDSRGIVRHSTRNWVTSDRIGRRAALVAARLNEQLELIWQGLSAGKQPSQEVTSYDRARRHAHALGFEYLENAHLLQQPLEVQLERLEALGAMGGASNPEVRTALLGTEPRPALMLAKLFAEYETAIRDEVRDFSADPLRIWRNGRMRAVERFVAVVGDKPVTQIKPDDAIDYCDWWRSRILKGLATTKTANKDIGQLSRMLKDMNIRRRLGIDDVFKGLRLRSEIENARLPFETDFIRDRLLAAGALDGLNEDARLIFYLVADTGLRLSEAGNLTEPSIHLDAPIPYVRVVPEGRRLKTEDSEREIPLESGSETEGEALNPRFKCRQKKNEGRPAPAIPKFPSELEFPHQDFGVSIEQAVMLSEMLMNWGTFDFYIEVSLNSAYNNIYSDNSQLKSKLDAGKQLRILVDLNKNGRLPSLASKYLGEVNFSFSNYKSPRNIISHGTSVSTPEGPVFMKFDGKRIPKKFLELYLRQSRYAVKAAYWMSQTIIGHPQPAPLPERPLVEPHH